MSRFKIVLFLVVTSLAGACVAAAWWLYTHVIGKDAVVVKQIHANPGRQEEPRPDPSLKRFEKAVEILRENTEEGRDALYELLRYFPDSTRATEAKRIIGEMNLDALFSPGQNSTRKDYVVQPGDSLGRIAAKNATTVECLLRANSMMSSALQPGDHLFVFPLEFEIQVSVGAKTLTLLRNGRFFKEYPAVEVRLPAGFKAGAAATPLNPGEPAPQPAEPAKTAPPQVTTKGSKKHHAATPSLPPGELTLNDKAAWVEGRRVAPADSHFIAADKWLMGSRPGFNIRALPVAAPVGGPAVITTATKTASASAKAAKTTHPPKVAKPAKVLKPVMTAAEDDEEADGRGAGDRRLPRPRRHRRTLYDHPARHQGARRQVIRTSL